MIVRDALTNHLDFHALNRSTQHRFRKGGSCLSNLLEFLDNVTNSLESHDSVDVIYLDFAKAFDKVPHLRLLEKIDKHGIEGKVRRWLQEWLSGRKQQVCLNGHASSWAAVTIGVPQGSVLGPILFLIYINDLDSHIVSSILKFADDTKLSRTVNNDSDRAVLQSDLHKLLEWSDKCPSVSRNVRLCTWAGVIQGSTMLWTVICYRKYPRRKISECSFLITSSLPSSVKKLIVKPANLSESLLEPFHSKTKTSC